MILSGDRAKWDEFYWGRHPQLLAGKRIIVDWYNGLPDSGALILAGNVGCGKSHVARAIHDLWGGWRTSFFGEVALAKAIQNTYDERALSEAGFIRQALFLPELFILDDLGAYQARDLAWMRNIYRRIFDDYLTVQGKPLLITTNLPLMGKNGSGIQDRIGARSFSRLCGAMRGPERYVNWSEVPDKRIGDFLKTGEK